MNKANIIFTLSVLLLCLFKSECASISPSQMQVILDKIDSLFFVANPTSQMDIRKFIRAAFHDCMGGCDGSFNLSNSANRGLQKYAFLMNNLYNTLINPRQNPTSSAHFLLLSRADFWMLCEQRALAQGIRRDTANPGFIPTINVPNGHTFYHGRPTTQPFDADNYQGTLPEGSDSWQTMLNVITVGLGGTTNENDIVALLGTHGSGITNFNNSGFNGPWGPRADLNVVNNHFFINLLSYNFPGNSFTQVSALSQFINNPSPPTPLDGNSTSAPPPTTNIQWNHIRTGPPNLPNSGARMMLPIDMQIYLDFTPNSTNGGSTIDGYCPQANNQTGNPNFIFDCSTISTPAHPYLSYRKNTAALALKYAQSNTLFLNDLIAAFVKMSCHVPAMPILNAYKSDYVCESKKWVCKGAIFFESCGPTPTAACV